MPVHCWQGPTGRVFFQYRAGSGRVLKKVRVAGRFGSGNSVEIFDRVFRVKGFRVKRKMKEKEERRTLMGMDYGKPLKLR